MRLFNLQIVVSLLLVTRSSTADQTAYSEEREIRASAANVSCRHWHDWSPKTIQSRAAMISGNQDPFGRVNNYARIECNDTKDGKTLFVTPSPALTTLWISPDQRYLVGLSNVKLWNPYQLVVYRMDGVLVLRMHVPGSEACFDRADFARFYSDHSQIQPLLQGRSIVRNNKIFVDYDFMNAPVRFGRETWLALDAKRCPSHLSTNITETTTNFVHWYRESEPGISLDRDERGAAIGLTLLDPIGVPIRISFKEAAVPTFQAPVSAPCSDH